MKRFSLSTLFVILQIFSSKVFAFRGPDPCDMYDCSELGRSGNSFFDNLMAGVVALWLIYCFLKYPQFRKYSLFYIAFILSLGYLGVTIGGIYGKLAGCIAIAAAGFIGHKILIAMLDREPEDAPKNVPTKLHQTSVNDSPLSEHQKNNKATPSPSTVLPEKEKEIPPTRVIVNVPPKPIKRSDLTHSLNAENTLIYEMTVSVIALLVQAISASERVKKHAPSIKKIDALKTLLESSLTNKTTDRILFDQLQTDMTSLVVQFDPSRDAEIWEILYEAFSLITNLANKLTFTAQDVAIAKLGDSKYSRDQAFSQMTLKELLAVAEAGDAEAQYKLGVTYENGQGVEDNCMAAARWYKLSAQQGYAKAQFNLALLYKSGLGVTQNLQTAKHWMEQAANANMPEAISALAASKKV
jgi:hypothetical protein